MPGGGRELLGKPPVYCRKTVNAVAADGCQVGFFGTTGVRFCLHTFTEMQGFAVSCMGVHMLDITVIVHTVWDVGRAASACALFALSFYGLCWTCLAFIPTSTDMMIEKPEGGGGAWAEPYTYPYPNPTLNPTLKRYPPQTLGGRWR